eukprot:COSAG02_NODE_1464_length_12487_cov_122.573297_7_plen_229_part_00
MIFESIPLSPRSRRAAAPAQLDWYNDWDDDAALLAGLEGAGALAATRPPARRVAVRADRTGRGRRGGWGARVGLARELPPQHGVGRAREHRAVGRARAALEVTLRCATSVHAELHIVGSRGRSSACTLLVVYELTCLGLAHALRCLSRIPCSEMSWNHTRTATEMLSLGKQTARCVAHRRTVRVTELREWIKTSTRASAAAGVCHSDVAPSSSRNSCCGCFHLCGSSR